MIIQTKPIQYVRPNKLPSANMQPHKQFLNIEIVYKINSFRTIVKFKMISDQRRIIWSKYTNQSHNINFPHSTSTRTRETNALVYNLGHVTMHPRRWLLHLSLAFSESSINNRCFWQWRRITWWRQLTSQITSHDLIDWIWSPSERQQLHHRVI